MQGNAWKTIMKKARYINVPTLITFAVMSFVAYYILLQDNFLHLSISSILTQAHDLEIEKHLIVLGLLPFYIAGVIFGTAMLSLYLGSIIHQSLLKVKYKAMDDKSESLSNMPSSL